LPHTVREGVGELKTLIFLGCTKSGSSKDAIEAAKQLGFYNILFTNRRSFLERREAFPHVDKMILVNLDNRDAILAKLDKLQSNGADIRAIVSFMDSYVSLAANLGEQLGLPTQSGEAIDLVQNKIAFRESLQDTQYSVPFQIIHDDSEDTALDLNLPVVVKSPRSTGSKDVLLATSHGDFRKHVEYLQTKYPDHEILVEEYIIGQQYLAEVLVHDGIPHVVAIVEQSITLDERFIVTGYCVLPTLPSGLMDQVQEMVNTVRELIGMQVGAFHVEFKVSQRGCKIIEVNPRISGAAMNRMISYAFGINLVKETIRSLFGEKPDLMRQKENFVYTQYVTAKQCGVLTKATGKVQAMRVPFVQEVFIIQRKNAILSTPFSMGHRYAYVIAAADSAREAKTAAMQAAARIHFHIRLAKYDGSRKMGKR
jgi:biotin carboxylase